jgi:hypothetical protein
MPEDDDEFRHYVPSLRRIIILVAVITVCGVIAASLLGRRRLSHPA